MMHKITIELTPKEYSAIDHALSWTLCNNRTRDWLLQAQSTFTFANKSGIRFTYDLPEDLILVPMTLAEASKWELENPEASKA